MHPTRRWTAAAALLAALAAISGCSAEAHDLDDAERAEAAAPAPAPASRPAPPPTPADPATEQAHLDAAAAALAEAFARVPVLTAREVAELRLDVNATQIAAARRLGTRVSGQAERERLRGTGRLVAMDDSTAYWILRRMEHSAPYATPDARAMLEAIGRRFHASLDSAGLPRYRMRITSVLRTDADQSALRRVNRNASSIVSAHEFGTTADVSHERFAVPAPPSPDTELPARERAMLEEAGKEHARVLQALLGRAIWQLRGEGVLHVMMEDAQPVYHMTVARPLAQPSGR